MRRTYYPQLITTAHLVAGVIAFAAQGCAQKQPSDQAVEHTVRKVPTETPKQATDPKTEMAPGVATEAKEDFERTLNQNLERLDEEIREMQSKITNLQEAAKAEWSEKMAKLDAKRREAKEKLDQIRKSSGEAWEHLREGADKAWEDLEQAVKKAAKEF